MMSKDLENVTSKEIRNELEKEMNCNLREYKGFIDNEMLIILGQMDKASLIFDHLYLNLLSSAIRQTDLPSEKLPEAPFTVRGREFRVQSGMLQIWKSYREQPVKCLVHCKMGVIRSASTVIAFAMKEYRCSLEKAYKHVKEKRNVAQPNAGFMIQLAEYEGILDASQHRHNSLWQHNSESDLQETVRDPLFKSTRISSEQDLSRDNHGFEYRMQKYNDNETARNSVVANKKSEPNNSYCYFRCLSDPIVDNASIKQQRELDQFSLQVDVERDAIQMNNGSGTQMFFCGTEDFVTSQFWNTYD